MKVEKRQEKENGIIDAAELVFRAVGYKNAKMEDISAKAGITKVTLYSYFQSKDNLYLAITFRSITALTDGFYTIIDENKDLPSFDVVLKLLASFMDFCSSNYLYSEALMDYFELNRSSNAGEDKTKLTDAVMESIYYRKIQDIQNLPFKIISNEVAKGQADGSILTNIDPMLYTLHAWTTSVGYLKVINSAGHTTLFNIDLNRLKEMNLILAEQILLGRIQIPSVATIA